MAALREDYERSLSAKSASQKDLQENLISAKHELLRVQEQLSLAEKVRRCGAYQCQVLIRYLCSRYTCNAAQLLRPLRWVLLASVQLFSSVCICVWCAGVGQEVPANCGLPQHEGDPDQEK